MSLLRSIRNVAVGYTSTQIKVRNATSNDDNSASTMELREISELTYNNQELFFIMDMIDKRLNDKGKNWRHVLKSLVLLDYLVYNGSENVIIWCHSKFYVIKTLREFQYRDESGKDYGNAIRVRAKELVSLLNNNDRLKEARREAQSRSRGSSSGGSRSGRRHQERDDSDDFGSRRSDRPSRYRSERSERSSRRQTPEEDDDIRRAIELSKQSVEEDERRRAQLRNASSEDINKAVSMSQAASAVQQQQTGLYSQDDWDNYQRAQQEYLQYQEQLAQQQQLEMQLAQQQQELAGFGQQFQSQYTGYQVQPQPQYSQYTGQPTGQPTQPNYTGYGQPTGQPTGQATGQAAGYAQAQDTGLQPLQPVKTGSNNPFATQNTGAPQQYNYQNQPPQQFQPQYHQPQAQQNNPFQQQYTGIATTQMQPSHTGYGFGNAQNQHRSNGDSLIDL